MKTVVTLVASVLLSLGLLTAPAHAEDAAPPACDMTTQTTELEAYKALAAGLNELLVLEKANVAAGNKIITRLVKRENRHKAKIAELRKTIRELRTKQQR